METTHKPLSAILRAPSPPLGPLPAEDQDDNAPIDYGGSPGIGVARQLATYWDKAMGDKHGGAAKEQILLRLGFGPQDPARRVRVYTYREIKSAIDGAAERKKGSPSLARMTAAQFFGKRSRIEEFTVDVPGSSILGHCRMVDGGGGAQ